MYRSKQKKTVISIPKSIPLQSSIPQYLVLLVSAYSDTWEVAAKMRSVVCCPSGCKRDYRQKPHIWDSVCVTVIIWTFFWFKNWL